MPYIKQEDRPKFDEVIPMLDTIDCAGDLNYVVSTLCRRYLERKGFRYANMNELVGALECTKLELYRRVAAPYEDKKIEENGDCY